MEIILLANFFEELLLFDDDDEEAGVSSAAGRLRCITTNFVLIPRKSDIFWSN